MSDEFLAELNRAIDSFNNDPPDSTFQTGYLAALEEVRKLYMKYQ